MCWTQDSKISSGQLRGREEERWTRWEVALGTLWSSPSLTFHGWDWQPWLSPGKWDECWCHQAWPLLGCDRSGYFYVAIVTEHKIWEQNSNYSQGNLAFRREILRKIMRITFAHRENFSPKLSESSTNPNPATLTAELGFQSAKWLARAILNFLKLERNYIHIWSYLRCRICHFPYL